MPAEVIEIQSSTENVCKKEKYQNEVTIRGRIFDESKPETFNQVNNMSQHTTFQG